MKLPSREEMVKLACSEYVKVENREEGVVVTMLDDVMATFAYGLVGLYPDIAEDLRKRIEDTLVKKVMHAHLTSRP